MRDMLWVSGDGGGGGVGRLVNEVERVGEEGGYVDQFCSRIDLSHGSNCIN